MAQNSLVDRVRKVDLLIARGLGRGLWALHQRTGLDTHRLAFISAGLAYVLCWWYLSMAQGQPEWLWYLLAPGLGALATYLADHELAGLVHAAIPHNVRLHAKRLRDVFPADFGGLSADPVVREAEAAAPVFSIVKGMTFVLIELPSLEHLAGVQRSQTQFPVATLLDEGFNTGFIARYYFVRLPPAEGSDAVRIRSRMIESDFEDPATGSAACSLCSYLAAFENKTNDGKGEDRKVRYEITQGVEMGRDSHIVVEVGTKGGKVDSVSLGGTAVQVMRGTVPYV